MIVIPRRSLGKLVRIALNDRSEIFDHFVERRGDVIVLQNHRIKEQDVVSFDIVKGRTQGELL